MSPHIHCCRRGLTLAEVLVSMAIMSMIAVTLASVSLSTSQVTEYTTGQGDGLQHARVVWERIQRIVQESTSAELHAGAVVVYDQIGNYRYPDTLLVWRPPSGTPTNASGPPVLREVVMYSTNPDNPNELIEYTNPFNSTQIPFDPAVLNTSAWRTTLANFKKDNETQKVVLTNLLRVAQPTNQTTSRGAVRFEVWTNPSRTDLAAYRAGTTLWKNLPWPTVSYDKTYGLRQLRVRIELQLSTKGIPGTIDNLGLETLPFFGSTTTMQRLLP